MKKLQTVRVLLNGASGKMGQAITRLIAENPQKNLIVSATRGPGQSDIKESFDIVVDFSTPQGAQEAFLLAKKYKKPFLTGTTNLPEPFFFTLQSEEKIPVFFAPSFYKFDLRRYNGTASSHQDYLYVSVYDNGKTVLDSGKFSELYGVE